MVDFGPIPFRFFHSWLELEGFHKLVVDTWNNDGITDANGLISFKEKLQNLKRVIHEWITFNRSDSVNLKKDHLSRLASIDVKIDQGCANESDLLNRHESIRILGELDRLEANDITQKARIKRATEGDENTGFFHATLKKKLRQLAIKGILKDGEWIEDPNNIKDEFVAHFCKCFQSASGHPPSLEGVMPNILSFDQSIFLESKITREEIKRAVWDCGGDRAPGPYGFTFKFFTTFWDLLEEDVNRFVQEFFIYGSFPKGCNSSFIALIPKVSNATLVTVFAL